MPLVLALETVLSNSLRTCPPSDGGRIEFDTNDDNRRIRTLALIAIALFAGHDQGADRNAQVVASRSPAPFRPTLS